MQQKFYLQLCINRFIYDHILPDRTTRVCQRLGTFQADLTQCKHCVVDLLSFGQLRANILIIADPEIGFLENAVTYCLSKYSSASSNILLY